jgi:hypothetical protein
MKRLALPILGLVAALAVFPVVFASGDNPFLGCGAAGDLGAVLATIRTLESGGDYTARAGGSSASGAYQFLDSTWSNFNGYAHPWQAPPEAQDAKAAENVRGILDRNDGDVTAVPVIWYIGHLPASGSPEWDQVPAPSAGNVLTPRQYQARWLAEYDRQIAGPSTPTSSAACAPGTATASLADGFAIPGPAELFANAPVDEPHHDYPAWDWPVPVGTPIYAVRGGRVLTVQYWPYNWWDHGCGEGAAGCQTCGIGVTIQDDTGTRWAYCHGSAATVEAGSTVAAGTQVLASGNTGRSSGPHVHIQIRTPDDVLRCPQSLMRSLRDNAMSIDPSTLPTTGCSY